MGHCLSPMPPPNRSKLPSVPATSNTITQTSKLATDDTNSNVNSDSKSPDTLNNSYTPDTPNTPNTPDKNKTICIIPSFLSIQPIKSENELYALQLQLRKFSLKTLDAQVSAQNSKYKRLYDIWNEFASRPYGNNSEINDMRMDINGFNGLMQKKLHIILLVIIHTDSLQTLFEIFDIENKDMAGILLAQNQHDSKEFNDNKVSFNEFKNILNSRTENDTILLIIGKYQCVGEITQNLSDIGIHYGLS